MFQLCELRKHQISEAHVRLYVVKNEVDPTPLDSNNDDIESGRGDYVDVKESQHSSSLYQKAMSSTGSGENSPLFTKHKQFIETCNMRLNHPNDETGGMLLLMVPQLVVHEIDEFSPLMPPPVWYPNQVGGSSSNNRNASHVSEDGAIRWNPPVYERLKSGGGQYDTATEFPNVMGRSIDEYWLNSSSVTGGSTSLHQTPLKSHHQQFFGPHTSQDEEKSMVQHYMEDRQVEIIAIVEGSAATSGGQVQARHSFLSSDIEWDKCFTHCMYKDPDDGCVTIDFSLYHELMPCSKDASSAGPIASII